MNIDHQLKLSENIKHLSLKLCALCVFNYILMKHLPKASKREFSNALGGSKVDALWQSDKGTTFYLSGAEDSMSINKTNDSSTESSDLKLRFFLRKSLLCNTIVKF